MEWINGKSQSSQIVGTLRLTEMARKFIFEQGVNVLITFGVTIEAQVGDKITEGNIVEAALITPKQMPKEWREKSLELKEISIVNK